MRYKSDIAANQPTDQFSDDNDNTMLVVGAKMEPNGKIVSGQPCSGG